MIGFSTSPWFQPLIEPARATFLLCVVTACLSGRAVEVESPIDGVPESCGDGVLDDGEDCDDGSESAACDLDCTFSDCGDAILNVTAGELCDDGGNSPTCDDDCTVAECGDGFANPAAGEDCDDTEQTAACDADCTVVECGDDTLNELAGEACDDGNGLGGDGCSALCTLPVGVAAAQADVDIELGISVQFESSSLSGDFNGDGLADVLLGDTTNDDGGIRAGAVYVFFGSAASDPVFDLDRVDVTFVGEDLGDGAGSSVANAGDVNGDGIDDLLVAAPFRSSSTGAAYLVYGGPTLTGSVDLSDAAARFVGAATGDRLGNVAGAGDFDGDGFDDILLSAQDSDAGGDGSGAAYVVYGGGFLTGTLNLVNADLEIVGENAGDEVQAVSSAGDVNGDGIDDLLVGANRNDEGGGDAGAAYVIFGSPTRRTGSLDLADADVKLVGQSTFDRAGSSVAGVGDVDADGFDDILVGAPSTDFGNGGTGTAYLIYGSAALTGAINLFASDTKLVGEAAGDDAGRILAGAGDVNGDGFADILIHARGNDEGGSEASAAYLIHGPVATGTLDLADADVKIIGDETIFGGGILAGGGDFDGDGLDDFMAGFGPQDARLYLSQP
ncbi:MAG: integrin alpha [Myxococcota bacterium]